MRVQLVRARLVRMRLVHISAQPWFILHVILFCQLCMDGLCARLRSYAAAAHAYPRARCTPQHTPRRGQNSHCSGSSGVNSVTGTSAIALAGRWLDQPRSIRPFGWHSLGYFDH